MSGRRGGDNPVTDLRDKAVLKRISKEHLLTPKIIEREVEIDALGGTVMLRSLTHAQRREIQDKCGFRTDKFDENQMTLLSIQYALVDPVLTEEDLEALNNQDYSVIDQLSLEISMMNFMGRAEEVKKESEETPSSDSASSSPATSG